MIVVARELYPTRHQTSRQYTTNGAHDVSGRHNTLRHAIAWSYDLLDEREQRLFQRLGVFVGGWTIEAAEAVCGDGLDSSFQVFDGLTSLLNKSLLRQQIGVDDEPRLGMLELIREYARERLMASDESDIMHRRHAEYFLTLAETAAPLIHGPDQVAWLERLEQEYDNFHAALQWSQTAAQDHELSLRLAVALARFWLAHSHLSEGRRWLEAALAAYPAVETSLRAKALFEAGALADVQGDHDRQRVLQGESLRIYAELGDKAGMAAALNCLGNAAHGDEQRRLHEQSLALYREIGDKQGISKALNNLAADVFFGVGDEEQALALWEENLALARELGDMYLMMGSLLIQGIIARQRGDHDRALGLLREALHICYRRGDRLTLKSAFYELGFTYIQLQQAICAARLWGAADRINESIGFQASPEESEEDERYRVEVIAQIGETAFHSAIAEGRAMRLDQAVAYALAEQSVPEQ